MLPIYVKVAKQQEKLLTNVFGRFTWLRVYSLLPLSSFLVSPPFSYLLMPYSSLTRILVRLVRSGRSLFRARCRLL